MKKIILLLAAVVLTGVGCTKDPYKDPDYLSRQLNSCEDELVETHEKLNQANDNIEQAQNYAWSDYEDMGSALDNLETVE